MTHKSIVNHYEENLDKIWVVGDIHGCFSKLESSMNMAGFNKETDKLFSVGDLVDRGPESLEAGNWIKKDYFYAIRGNHEDMFLKWLEFGDDDLYNYGNEVNGGGWALKQKIEDLDKLAEQFHQLPYLRIIHSKNKKIAIVHAELPKNITTQNSTDNNELDSELVEIMTWNREKVSKILNKKYNNNDRIINETANEDFCLIIVGHTPIKNAFLFNSYVYIDTAGWIENKKFTLMRLSEILKIRENNNKKINEIILL